jgi:hypothetical protein
MGHGSAKTVVPDAKEVGVIADPRPLPSARQSPAARSGPGAGSHRR